VRDVRPRAGRPLRSPDRVTGWRARSPSTTLCDQPLGVTTPAQRDSVFVEPPRERARETNAVFLRALSRSIDALLLRGAVPVSPVLEAHRRHSATVRLGPQWRRGGRGSTDSAIARARTGTTPVDREPGGVACVDVPGGAAVLAAMGQPRHRGHRRPA